MGDAEATRFDLRWMLADRETEEYTSGLAYTRLRQNRVSYDMEKGNNVRQQFYGIECNVGNRNTINCAKQE